MINKGLIVILISMASFSAMAESVIISTNSPASRIAGTTIFFLFIGLKLVTTFRSSSVLGKSERNKISGTTAKGSYKSKFKSSNKL